MITARSAPAWPLLRWGKRRKKGGPISGPPGREETLYSVALQVALAFSIMSSFNSYRNPKSLSGSYYDEYGGIQQGQDDRVESRRRAVNTNNDSVGTPAIAGSNMKNRWQPPKRSSVAAATPDVIMSDRGPGNKSKKSHHSKARKPSKHGAPSSRLHRIAKKKVVVSPDLSTSTAPETHEELHKLNPSVDVHARRIHQRRRQVNFGKKGGICVLPLLPHVCALTNIFNEGKNTIGYEEYIKQVPKHRRKPRCPDHPQTPDYTLDIPARRWQVRLFVSLRKLLCGTDNH